MPTASATHRAALRALDDWEPYILANSNLPGPRANLELAYAVMEEGDPAQFESWAALDAQAAPGDAPAVLLSMCGVMGLGRLIAEGRRDLLPALRGHASDPRWRVREGVAMALQRIGDADMPFLLEEMRRWAAGSRLEQRAAVAGLAEPRLLRDPAHAAAVLALFDRVTATVAGAPDRRSDDFRVLRQALGYAWSVAAVALPDMGLPLLEKWLAVDDPDVRWIMRENWKKNRLKKLAEVTPLH
jgi:hypothetical protein